jgi:hypothetical protein
VSLVGDNASKSQVVKDAVDRLLSIGGIIYSVEVCTGNLSICFAHDPMTTLKALHELVAHYDLKSINLKENLRQVKVEGRGLEYAKSLLPELLRNNMVHRLNTCSSHLILTVEESALEEVHESLTKGINHPVGST